MQKWVNTDYSKVCGLILVVLLLTFKLWKESLNSDGQQFHQQS
jgi:hypothetical protein